MLAALAAVALLAACTSAATDAPAPSGPAPRGLPSGPLPSGLNAVTVGGTDKVPTVTFTGTGVSVPVTTTKVVRAGTGITLSKANKIVMQYALYNGRNGKQISSTFGGDLVYTDLASNKLMVGLTKGLVGQRAGSTLLLGIAPADGFGAKGNPQSGVGPTDTLVYFINVLSATTPIATAGGIAVEPKAGLPTARVDGSAPAQITVPKTAPPTGLIVQPLIMGSGATVGSGQGITVTYTGVLWRDGTTFAASASQGGPMDYRVGTGAMPGWDAALVNQTVGSRILLVVPPAKGYAAGKAPSGVGAQDTLVFVVDILDVTGR